MYARWDYLSSVGLLSIFEYKYKRKSDKAVWEL